MFHSKQRIRGGTRVGPSKQRGAALIFTAFILLALVTALALAIDVGRLYAAQQNIQTAADIAAIEAARAISGCNTADGTPPANPALAASTAVANSVTRNFANRGASNLPTSVVNIGAAQPDALNPGLRVFQANAGLPAPAPGTQPVANSAVQVILTDPVPSNLFPIFPTFTVSATASAQNTPRATFSVGSTLLELNPDFLGPIGIDIGVFDQGALTNANVDLGAVALELGVATPDDLLSTSLPLDQFIDAIDTVSGGALGGLAAALAPSLGGTVVTLGDVLIASGPLGESAQAAAGPLADALLQAALADRADPITIPINGISIPGVASTSVDLRILEPPRIAQNVRPGLADSMASSSQLVLQINIDINAPILPGSSIQGDLPIFVRSGRADARLTGINCANSVRNFHNVVINANAITTDLGIGRFNDLNATVPVPVEGGSLTLSVGLPALPLLPPPPPLTLGVNITGGPVALGNASDTLTFATPPLPLEQQISGGITPGGALSNLVGSTQIMVDPASLAGLGAVANIALAPVLPLLEPTLTTVLNTVALDVTLSGLLSGLGFNFGAAQVILQDTDIDRPEIFQSVSGTPAPAAPPPAGG